MRVHAFPGNTLAPAPFDVDHELHRVGQVFLFKHLDVVFQVLELGGSLTAHLGP